MNQLKLDLENITKSIHFLIEHSEYQEELRFLIENYKISIDGILQAWLAWDMPQEFGNGQYDSPEIRLIMHMHNRLPGLWHEKRQSKVLDYLLKGKPETICEIWFGTPQAYVEKYSTEYGRKIVLCDFDKASVTFGKTLVKYWAPKNRSVSFKNFDINSHDLPSGFDCYIFQDSIEHASDPTGKLRSYAGSVCSGTDFIFSLPLEIENPIPQHFIYWKNLAEMENWLTDSWLVILESEVISMDKERDIFARNFHPDFKEVAFWCKKK